MSCELVTKFIHHCQDLIMKRTKDLSFDYVYITEENTEKLLVFINCLTKRNNRLVLSHALSQTFVCFLAKDVDEVVDKITEFNDELILTQCKIVVDSTSDSGFPNPYARLFKSRTKNDCVKTSYKYSDNEWSDTKTSNYILNSPFIKYANTDVLKELQKRLGKTCTTTYEYYDDDSEDDEYRKVVIEEHLKFYDDKRPDEFVVIEKMTETQACTNAWY